MSDPILRLDMTGRIYTTETTATGLQVLRIAVTNDELRQVAEAARAAQVDHPAQGANDAA